MPSGRDWVRLAKETFRAVDRRDIVDLYRVQWRGAAAALIGDESASIGAARGMIRRFIRKANAVLYGLTQRLAPARRVLFILGLWVLLQGSCVFVDSDRTTVTVDLHWIGLLLF